LPEGPSPSQEHPPLPSQPLQGQRWSAVSKRSQQQSNMPHSWLWLMTLLACDPNGCAASMYVRHPRYPAYSVIRGSSLPLSLPCFLLCGFARYADDMAVHGSTSELVLCCAVLAVPCAEPALTYQATPSTEIQAALPSKNVWPFLNIFGSYNRAVPHCGGKALCRKLFLLDAELYVLHGLAVIC